MSQSTAETDLRENITVFLRRNFPQIRMHGGGFQIETADPETGEVHITLNGACSGCGISPMTITAIQNRMVKNLDAVEEVTASTMESDGPSFPSETSVDADDEDPSSPADISNAPF